MNDAGGPPPPFHRVPGLVTAGQVAVEGYREGVRVETPKPSVKWLWKEKATEAALRFLRDTRVGCISTRRKPPEEECDGNGLRPGPPQG